jgi:hypothetical protein
MDTTISVLVSSVVSSAVVAAVISGIISLISTIINHRQSKKDLYAQTVSSNRMMWIRDIRRSFVDLIVLCRTINSDEKNERKKKRIKLH